MNNKRVLILLVSAYLFIIGCSSESRFPTEKRFWTPDDYREAIWQIQYRTPKGEEYPRFSNSETSIVIQKLVDPQNYEVVLDDTELGLNHRNEVAQAFFDQYKELQKAYRVMDIQDKYVYAQELIEIEKFGLGLQIKYFRLGNDRIIEQSDAPESARTKEILTSNEQTLIKNFTIYLDDIGDERYFSSHAPLLAEGISIHFFKLIETYPNANYGAMLSKANLILKKVQSEELKLALTSLISKLESLKDSSAQ